MMTVNRYLRLVAGVFVLASVALAYFVSPWFLLFTTFVALNLIQSAFSNTCPVATLLRRAGVPESSATHVLQSLLREQPGYHTEQDALSSGGGRTDGSRAHRSGTWG